MERIQTEHPNAAVEVWSEDEHRIGLHPLKRRIWVEQGEQPTAKVNWKREWLWLYAFVQPQTGQTYWWILKRSRRTEYSARRTRAPMLIRGCSAAYFKTSPSILVWVSPNALSCHWIELGGTLAVQLEVPEGIHLVPLPPYSPQLQPAERLWPLVNEPLANQAFKTIAEVEELVIQRCRRLLVQQRLVQGLTFYHWWPEVVQTA